MGSCVSCQHNQIQWTSENKQHTWIIKETEVKHISGETLNTIVVHRQIDLSSIKVYYKEDKNNIEGESRYYNDKNHVLMAKSTHHNFRDGFHIMSWSQEEGFSYKWEQVSSLSMQKEYQDAHNV